MRTAFSPQIRCLLAGLAAVVMPACSPSEKTPLTRDVEVSVSFAWAAAGSTQQRPANLEVGAMAYEKAKEPIAIAKIRRDATVNDAWKEKQKQAVELEKLRTEFESLGLASAPVPMASPMSQLKKDVEACRDALNNLADTAVLYLEDVKQNLGADFDKERVARFRKNLGAEELRDLALAIKAENTPQVRQALGEARGILGREVWAGRAEDKDRGLRIISALESALTSAAPPRMITPRTVPKGTADLKERIVTMMREQLAWENRLAMANRPIHMYTALGDPEFRAKTDGDGKCHLILPREGRYVLFAYAERPFPAGMSEIEQGLRIAEKEEMIWVVEAPGSGSERASIALTENNAARPGVAPLKMESKGE